MRLDGDHDAGRHAPPGRAGVGVPPGGGARRTSRAGPTTGHAPPGDLVRRVRSRRRLGIVSTTARRPGIVRWSDPCLLTLTSKMLHDLGQCSAICEIEKDLSLAISKIVN
jgi:hypothetical protein